MRNSTHKCEIAYNKMITLLITQLFWVVIYVQNPFWSPLLGTLVYFANIPLPIHALMAFPISIHFIVRDLKRGIHPDYQKLIDLEVARWLLVLVLNLVDDTILRVVLGGHCAAIMLGMILEHYDCKHTQHYIVGFNLLWMCVIFITFFHDLSQIGTGFLLAWFNGRIHWELHRIKRPFRI